MSRCYAYLHGEKNLSPRLNEPGRSVIWRKNKTMSSTKIHDIYMQLPVSSQRTFPVGPFPRNYIHGVVDDLFFAVQAVLALRMEGIEAEDIHVMASWDFVDAVEHKLQRQNGLSKAWQRLLTFFDEGFGDTYLQEALQGHHILTVRITRHAQREQVRTLLASNHAYHIKYVDAWTVTDLPSQQALSPSKK
jgi:hypothetical protein